MFPLLQAFEKGRYLGRLDLHIDPVSRRAKLIDASYIKVTADIVPDPEIAAIVNDYNERLGQQFKEVIGRSDTFTQRARAHPLPGDDVRQFHHRYYAGPHRCPGCMINAGALRASIKEGPVTVEDVFRAMPYGNELVRVELTGAEIRQVLQRAVQGAREDEDGGFLHVAGLVFDVRGRIAGNIRVGKSCNPWNRMLSIPW
ncbi:MAG: 5'-nucleotidase C-terminal domain-containing protein [Desulfobacterales bacterium]